MAGTGLPARDATIITPRYDDRWFCTEAERRGQATVAHMTV
jgi:hypothetical protein